MQTKREQWATRWGLAIQWPEPGGVVSRARCVAGQFRLLASPACLCTGLCRLGGSADRGNQAGAAEPTGSSPAQWHRAGVAGGGRRITLSAWRRVSLQCTSSQSSRSSLGPRHGPDRPTASAVHAVPPAHRTPAGRGYAASFDHGWLTPPARNPTPPLRVPASTNAALRGAHGATCALDTAQPRHTSMLDHGRPFSLLPRQQ